MGTMIGTTIKMMVAPDKDERDNLEAKFVELKKLGYRVINHQSMRGGLYRAEIYYIEEEERRPLSELTGIVLFDSRFL